MSLGNVDLTLGLNTGPATQALNQYLQAMKQSGSAAAQSQKGVDVALSKQAQNLGSLKNAYSTTGATASKAFQQAGAATDKVTKKVNQLDGAMDRLGNSAKGAGNTIATGFTRAFQNIPEGIGLAVGQQIVQTMMSIPQAAMQAAAGSVEAFAQIDAALRQTLAIAGEDAARFDELAKFMNELATETVFTATELAEASVQLSRAGFSADELKEALPGIAMGAAAAGESMGSMSDVVIAALGGFQLGTDETSKVVDVLTAAANNANTSVGELGEGLKYVGPIAQSLGVSVEDTAALMGLLANAGIKASQAGTTLRGGFSRLARAAAGTNSELSEYSRGTSRLSGVLKEMSVDIADANGNLLPTPQLLGKLREGFAKLEGTEKNLAASILFGEEAGAGWVSLLNTNADEVDNFFQTTANAQGTAAETAEQNLAGIAGALKLLESATQSVSIAFGKFLDTALEPIVRAVTAALNAFNSLPEPIQQAAFAVGILTAGLTALGVAMTIIKGIQFGSIFGAVTGAVTQSGVSVAAFASSLSGKFVAAATLAKAKIVALNGAIAAMNAKTIGTALMTGLNGIVAGFGKALLAVKAFATASVAGMAKAAQSALAFTATLGPLALALAAIGTVALVWDTYSQMQGQANEINEIFAEGALETNGILEEQAEVIESLRWDIAAERVGVFNAALDKLRSALGIATVEANELDNATVTLGKRIEELDGRFGTVQTKIRGLVNELKSGKLSAAEYQEKLKELQETKKAMESEIQKVRAGLVRQLKQMEKTAGATGKLGESEQRLISTLKASIKGLDAQERILNLIAGSAPSAAAGMNQLAGSNDRAAQSSQRLASAIDQQKNAIERMKAAQATIDTSFQTQERNLARVEQLRKNAAAKEIEAIKRVDQARITSATKRAEATAYAMNQEMKAADRIGKAHLDSLKARDKAADAAHKLEMQRFDQQLAALDARKAAAMQSYDAQVAALREMTPAEMQLAELEKDRLEAAVKLGGEEGLRAQAQLERMEREKKIAKVEEERAEKAAKLAEEQKLLEEEKEKAQRKADTEKELRQRQMEEASKRHDQEMLQRREQIALFERNSQLEIQKMKEEAAAKQQEMADAEKQKQEEVAAARFKREEDHRKQQEANAKALQKAVEKLSELQDEADGKRAEAEKEYRSDIEETSNFIVKEGEKTWSTYSSNAVQELQKVEAAARQAAQAAAAARKAAGSNPSGGGYWTGGLIQQGQRASAVNELGQEAFLGKSGQLSLIDRPAWSSWMPPETGTVIPAHITAKLGIPPEGINLNAAPGGSSAAASNVTRASIGGNAQLIRAISSLKDSGGRITNNVSIESAQPVQAASDMMVELHKIRRRRFG